MSRQGGIALQQFMAQVWGGGEFFAAQRSFIFWRALI
jgi:hypothetical protein